MTMGISSSGCAVSVGMVDYLPPVQRSSQHSQLCPALPGEGEVLFQLVLMLLLPGATKGAMLAPHMQDSCPTA